jgi:hypothetical protein
MTAPKGPKTTIGQLLYTQAPALNFARLVSDLDAALTGLPVAERNLSWAHDDIAILDIDGSRIGLCFARELTGLYAAAVTVTVGYGTSGKGEARLAQRQEMLARLVAERIAGRFQPDETIWRETNEVATPELFDLLTEALPPRPAPAADAPAAASGRPRRVQARTGRATFADPADLPRILARFDATLAARRAGRPDPAPAEIANDLPHIPAPDIAVMTELRNALCREAEQADPRRRPIMRLAAHTLDATLMVVALPVGAAMMTYSIGKGASLRASAMAMALCGIGIGTLQAIGATEILSVVAPAI